jgi:hypothetical protein
MIVATLLPLAAVAILLIGTPQAEGLAEEASSSSDPFLLRLLRLK